MNVRRRIDISLLHLAVTLAACVCLVPFVWMIGESIAPGDRQFELNHLGRLFSRASLANFREIIAHHRFFTWVLNSLFLACTSTVLVVMISALAAFALSKFTFVGQRVLMGVMLLTMLIPGQVLLPGSYDVVWRLGWINSFAALLVPASVNVLGVFLFRQAMLAVPDELLHAARVDGCGELRVWWDVMLPSIRPMIGAFTLLSFIGSWNSFLWPQIVLQDETKFTLPMGLANLMSEPGTHGYGPLMAGTLLSLVPVAVLFFALQRDFVAGVTSGAVKG